MKIIQDLTKSIARLALESEFNVDVEVRLGQWNSWTQKDVETKISTIEDYVKNIKTLLVELGGQDA